MQPAAQRLAPQPWMTSGTAVAIISALDKAGGTARFVGGCVRNALLGVPVKDVDIATDLPPDAAMSALQKAGLRAIPTGIEHGTVTALGRDHAPHEITTLRRDVSTDGRRAVVAYTDNWAEDARRRDFTINALYADPDGTLYDPTGGLADLAARRVRFIGDPEARIREDYLRILRFFRILAWYGAPPPDAQAVQACAALRGGLERISGERLQAEFLRLLEAPDAAMVLDVLRLMAGTDVLAHVVPGPIQIERLARLSHGGFEQAPDALLRLAALLGGDGVQAAAVRDNLRLSNDAADRLGAAIAAPVDPALDARTLRVQLYRHGRRTVHDRLMLSAAAAGLSSADIAEASAIIAAWTPPHLPVNGADALALGLKPGPAVGAALGAVEAWWIAEDFAPDRAACLQRLQAVINGG